MTSEQAAEQQAQAQLENIKVAVRLRPFTEKEKQRASKRNIDIEQNTVALYSPKYGASDEPKKFTFDYSYWSHDGFKRRAEDGVNVPDAEHANGSKYISQEKVFEDLGLFLLENALQGYDSALLAYGQTGSGKSYTVSGYGSNEGILPRFARELFAELNKRLGAEEPEQEQANDDDKYNNDSSNENKTNSAARDEGAQNRYEVYFSMIEIYNEVVRDLLVKSNVMSAHQASQSSVGRRGLKVREHPKRGFFVENLSSFKCANKGEIERLIEEGQLNKSIVATSMNETSSRGHTIYEFRIRQYRSASGEQAAGTKKTTLTCSIVQLVDLAGSERMAVHTAGELVALPSRSESPFVDAAPNLSAATPRSSRKQTSKSLRTSRAAASASSTGSSGGLMRTAKAHAAGLLGSASQQQQLHHHQRFKESVSINQSLSALGNCIQVLSQYSQQQANPNQSQLKPPKIPYRDSVLTKLLNRCCLSGTSKVVIIATLSPAEANYDDTLSTLRFADRAKQIKMHAVVNRMDTSQVSQQQKRELVGVLQRENERLKQLIDGRITATKSDDSSQTSNFDDTENMVENFNGPAEAGAGAGAGHRSSKQLANGGDAASATPRPSAAPSATQPVRSRTTVRKRQTAPSSSEAATTRSRSRPPPATSSKSAANKTTAKLPGSSSIPALMSAVSSSIGDGEPSPSLKKLVSPAASKQAAAKRLATGSLSDDEDDRATVGGSNRTLKKSKSLAHFSDNGATLGEQILADDFDITDLLDEIDLNDLANSNEGILSPDSDDSFAALADEGLSNEGKMNLLNRLLSNSNVAEKIRKQYEKQQARSRRPRRAGANRNNLSAAGDEVQMISAMNSALKKINPYLSNLNQDEQLTGVITFIIKEGETIVGKNQDCDFMLFGPELRGRHAKLTRTAQANDTSQDKDRSTSSGKKDDAPQVFIEPLMEQADSEKSKRVAVMVNGEPVTKKIRLNHCDRILFGSGAYFVFVDNTVQEQSNGYGDGEGEINDARSVTYDMAHNEVLRKVMSEATNEAVIKEINDYTHRPGTGKHKSQRATAHQEPGSELLASESDPVDKSKLKQTAIGETSAALREADKSDEQHAASEEPGPQKAEDESFRDKLMDDTYEFAMPVAEVNAIAKEMGIKVVYGLKILTGEEQFLDQPHYDVSTESYYNHYTDSLNGSDTMSGSTSTANASDERVSNNDNETNLLLKFKTVTTRSVKPETLDIPPELYINVYLEEFNVQFFWSKHKFHERRVKMLELFGAWDVGGKSGLVEYLIEQSKYQGFYIIDPFIDDPLTSFILIGHAQVTLQPLSHMSDMKQSFDILDVNDETVGQLNIQAIPCYSDNKQINDGTNNFKPLDENALAESFIENPKELLGKKFVFLLKICSCHYVPDKYFRIFCQYSLDREKSPIRTIIQRDDNIDLDQSIYSAGSTHSRNSSSLQAQKRQTGRHAANSSNSKSEEPLDFDHTNYIVIDEMNQDILDFIEHGFLTIQLVGQYRLDYIQSQRQQQSSPRANSSSNSAASSSSNSATLSSPTLISTIISSINKYKYRIEQQGSAGGSNNRTNYPNEIYTTGLTDSAKSNNRIPTGNSGASSIASTSATVNIFDQQNEDDDGAMNGLSQENIIDMILTKRKLDRAENQLHYLKRTINIAEHYNKKNIPVKTVKKLLNSYGHELEGGRLEELAADVTVERKSSNSKHSGCLVM